MAKSNPIGVRFDERLFSKYPGLSPQKILNKLTENDFTTGKPEARVEPDEIYPITVTPLRFKIKPVKDQDAPPKYKPEKLPGESAIDYRIRCEEEELPLG